ncbi:MAG: hypothetical protein HN763_10045 [Opitutales bacterium]|nr:hypothetical protein [Opitutales bacterium]MBT6379519.1 hypothetical protein [Opitutales bacterium]MBT6769660.1 hypothetical protein [Opitutales bacterium]MBT7866682.1 hypothetical protein [Opitutales bacterium]
MCLPHFISCFLVAVLLPSLSSLAGPLAKKGKLILDSPFERSLTWGESVTLQEGWIRRVSAGDWSLQSDGSLLAVNVPEHNHGPVITYTAPINDIIIECEFKLPAQEGPNRHFRIFLDQAGYAGHNIQSTANVSSTFRPVGLTLQHLLKDKEKKSVADVDFGLEALNLKGDVWYTMRLEVLGDKARTTVAGKTLGGQLRGLNVEKSKIGLNPGLAGGSIRNFKAWEVDTGS